MCYNCAQYKLQTIMVNKTNAMSINIVANNDQTYYQEWVKGKTYKILREWEHFEEINNQISSWNRMHLLHKLRRYQFTPIYAREIIILLINNWKIDDVKEVLSHIIDKIKNEYPIFTPILLALKKVWKLPLALELFERAYWTDLNEDQEKIRQILLK